ncbi:MULTISPECIES: hypothetical protein [Streptomyces]|uniref:Uncharacterized protein n=2 Tax=Streptomyces TaxID=1883 RepID=A0ABV9IK20_9ACTN
MLNRIRRAVSLTRARHAPKGRHRRPLTPVPPSAASLLAPADASAVVLGHASASADHEHSLTGEDNALVRPYVLAWETRVRTRSVVVAPHPSAAAWSTLAGVS